MTPNVSAGSRREPTAGDVAPLPIRVVVVDDHELLRQTVRVLLRDAGDVEWVGEAGDGSEAVDLVARTRPDVVLMDLSMPGTDGLSATRRIVHCCPSTRVLVLTSSTDPAHVRLSLEAGAAGVLAKDGNSETILAGIRSVARAATG